MPDEGPLKLADEDFWGDIRRTEGEVKPQLIHEGFEGLLIDAPQRVPLGARSTLPVVGWHVRTLKEDRQVDLIRDGLVVGVNQETNQVKVGYALRPDKPLPKKKPHPSPPGKGKTLNMFEVDARKRLNLHWDRDGRWRFAVILRERVSNTVGSELVIDEDFEDPEAARLIAEERRRNPPKLEVWPALPSEPEQTLPRYVPEEEDPPVPAEPGIVLAADRVVVTKPGATCLLRGSFRLPVLERERVKPHPDTGLVPQVGDPRATCVVPITLMATGSKAVGPLVFHLKVPSYDPAEAAGAEVTGAFAIDLFALEAMSRRPQTYFFYAFNGAAHAGPTPVALVSEDMLRED